MPIGGGLLSLTSQGQLYDTLLASHWNSDGPFHHHFVTVDPNEIYPISVKDRLTRRGVNMSRQLDPFYGFLSGGVFACPSHLRLHHCDGFSIGQRRCGWCFSGRINEQQPKPRGGNGDVTRHLLSEGIGDLVPGCGFEIKDLPAPDKLVLGCRL